jgi:acetylornithine deacetylase/succinyl-diaminopimelate desuccinylase-like protein
MLAIPGVTEKGLYNVRIEVHGPGGHSSMPPQHTVSVIPKFAMDVVPLT